MTSEVNGFIRKKFKSDKNKYLDYMVDENEDALRIVANILV